MPSAHITKGAERGGPSIHFDQPVVDNVPGAALFTKLCSPPHARDVMRVLRKKFRVQSKHGLDARSIARPKQRPDFGRAFLSNQSGGHQFSTSKIPIYRARPTNRAYGVSIASSTCFLH